MKKGQYFSFDAIIAAVIFVASISLLTTYWFGVRAIMDARSYDLFGEALRVSDSLLTPGNPPDWHAHPVKKANQIGFTIDYRSNILDELKIENFSTFVNNSESNYRNGRERLHIVDDYYITVKDDQGNILYDIGKPPTNATNIANAHRAAILNDKLVTLRVQLWNNRTIG